VEGRFLVRRSYARATGTAIGTVGLYTVVAKGLDHAATGGQGASTAIIVNVVVVNLHNTACGPVDTIRAIVVNLRVTGSHYSNSAASVIGNDSITRIA